MGDPRPELDGHAVKGIAMSVAAVFVFALGDVATKHLAMLYSAPLIIAARYAIGTALILILRGPTMGRALWRTNRTGLVVIRALVLAMATLTLVLALRRMPVAETVSIIYLSPFAVMILSIPILGERVGGRAWIAAVVGFAGVLVIMRPGTGLDPVGVALTVANAALATTYNLMSRHLAGTETPIAMLFYTSAIGAVLFSLMLPWSLGDLAPSTVDLLAFVALGLLATGGHFLVTAAAREAPASVLAPVTYLHLVWAGLLGWLFFGQFPDHVSLIGMAMVAGAGVAIALGARGRQPRSRPTMS